MAITPVQRAVATAGAIVLAFLLGFGWQAMRASRIDDRLRTTEHRLAFTELEATLGAAAIEAERSSFEAGRQLASDFFTGLQAFVDRAPESARAELRSILGERDATITMLSRADPEAANHLERLFVRFRLARGIVTRTPLAPAPAPGAAPLDTAPPPPAP